MIAGTVEVLQVIRDDRSSDGGIFEERLESERPESNQNCIFPVAASECASSTPCLRIPTVAFGTFCVGCYGGVEERDVSVDFMRTNDGSFVGCTREIANRMAARNVGCASMAADDGAWFGWVLVDIVVMAAMAGIIIMALNVAVAGLVVSVNGCSVSIRGNQSENTTVTTAPIFHAISNTTTEKSGPRRPKFRDNIISESLAQRCPTLATLFSTRTVYYTVLLPCFGTVAVAVGVKAIGWSCDSLQGSVRSVRSKRKYEA